MHFDPLKTAFTFPGQGSQEIGMGKDLAKSYSRAREVFQQADDILGFFLSKIAWEDPRQELNDTINTQPALLVHSIASLRVFQEQIPDFQPAFVAGHSLGELSALVAAGVLDFPDALNLVRRRGELMKKAGEITPGGMGAILALEIPTVEEICLTASRPGEEVQVANDNCPGQVVISGAISALERALPMAKEAGARRAVKLAVSIAAHSNLMEHAQAGFNLAIQNATFSSPKIPVIGNVTAAPLSDIDAVQNDLQAQLTSRVRWTESITKLIDQGVTTFIEIGTGKVLTGLGKRINRESERINLGSPEDFAKLQ